MALSGKRRRPSGQVFHLGLNVYCGFVFVFLMLPLLIVFPISFSSSAYLQFPPPSFSLRWYESYLNDPTWIAATVRSFYVATITMIIATVLGTMAAFALVRARYPGRALFQHLTTAPLIVPTIVYSVAVYGLFSALRLIGNWQGIVLAHSVHAIPYVVLIVAASLRSFDEALEQAAMGLGASRWRAILHVTLPQIRPAVISAAFIAFISSFDELVIAMFLSGTNVTLPKKMFDNILYEIDPTIAVVSVLQIVLVTVVLVLATRFGAGVQPVR